jgi:hypothetical protein
MNIVDSFLVIPFFEINQFLNLLTLENCLIFPQFGILYFINNSASFSFHNYLTVSHFLYTFAKDPQAL